MAEETVSPDQEVNTENNGQVAVNTGDEAAWDPSDMWELKMIRKDALEVASRTEKTGAPDYVIDAAKKYCEYILNG